MWRKEAEGTVTDQDEMDRFFDLFSEIMVAIVASTHNAVFRLLIPAVQRVRSLRHWNDEPSAVEADITMERDFLMETVRALESRDTKRVRAAATRWTTLPAVAVDAMKETPAGERVSIRSRSRSFASTWKMGDTPHGPQKTRSVHKPVVAYHAGQGGKRGLDAESPPPRAARVFLVSIGRERRSCSASNMGVRTTIGAGR